MTYQREREQFIARVTQEGLPLHVAQALLREATGINRRAELACSIEAADRDRVPCPASLVNGRKRLPTIDGVAPCLCDDYPQGSHAAGKHATIPRITLQDWHAEQRVKKLLGSVDAPGWDFSTEGDPRGYTLRVIPPSYAERNTGRDKFNLESIGVPSGPSGLRF